VGEGVDIGVDADGGCSGLRGRLRGGGESNGDLHGAGHLTGIVILAAQPQLQSAAVRLCVVVADLGAQLPGSDVVVGRHLGTVQVEAEVGVSCELGARGEEEPLARAGLLLQGHEVARGGGSVVQKTRGVGEGVDIGVDADGGCSGCSSGLRGGLRGELQCGQRWSEGRCRGFIRGGGGGLICVSVGGCPGGCPGRGVWGSIPGGGTRAGSRGGRAGRGSLLRGGRRCSRMRGCSSGWAGRGFLLSIGFVVWGGEGEGVSIV